MNNSSGQQDFNFDGNRGQDGYSSWQAQRRLALEQLSRELGLPIGHGVEVWLHGGIRLRGIMRLRDAPLFLDAPRDLHLELQVDGVPFRHGDIESCVRLY